MSKVKLSTFLVFAATLGCGQPSQTLGTTWHQKCGWKAEDYFDDPKVIALCHAIEANDLAEIRRCVAAGADVNALGKGKMTPLLWAYPDNKLDRFAELIKLGANPNVVVESDFNTHGGIRKGDSVTHMACETKFRGYFEAVFNDGGDPNFVRNGIISKETPLFTVITGAAPDKLGKVRRLIEKGANLNHVNGAGSTPVTTAVAFGMRFDIAVVLLKAGADPLICRRNSNTRLVHVVIGSEPVAETWTDKQKSDYQELLSLLAQHGESLDAARADLKRWRSWDTSNGEFRRKMDAEIAERKAKEAKERATTQQPRNDAK